MYEATMLLNGGMVTLLLSLACSVFFMIFFHRKKDSDEYDKHLQKNARIFSLIPFIFNSFLLVLLFSTFIFPEKVLLLLLFVFIVGLGISAVLGPAFGALGLFFSICFTAKHKKRCYIHCAFGDIINCFFVAPFKMLGRFSARCTQLLWRIKEA